MRSRTIFAFTAFLLVAVFIAASPATAQMSYGEKKSTCLTVFAAHEKQSGGSGYGIALSQYGKEVTDLSAADLGDFRLYQFSKLAPKKVGPYMVDFGFTVGYADPKDGFPDAPKDLFTGLVVILGKSESSQGISLDLRVSSLSREFNPMAWFTDPDIFWFGAGLSYSF